MADLPPKPRPVPTAETRPYWEGCAREELLFQSCESCGQAQFPPNSVCLTCRGAALTWTRSCGRGTIHSFTVVRRPPLPSFKADVPYAVALVDLEEGIRLMVNVFGSDPEALAIDQAIEIVFERRDGDVVLPQARVRG